MMNLKPFATTPAPCPICKAPAPLFGVVDFNRNCEIEGGVKLPPIGVPVYHRRCTGCGFLFTDAFDDWSHDDFKAHIYNEDYGAVDPEYRETRPRNNAALMMQLGVDGVFVGSGIFKSKNPAKYARAIVEATTHFRNPEIVARASEGLGEAMKGLEIKGLPLRMQERE